MNKMIAQMIKLKAGGHWEGGLRTTVQTPDHGAFTLDLPREMGGTDSGPCPMEYLLGSLIGCEVATLANVAKKMNFNYWGVDVIAEGDIDLRGMELVPGVKPYFQEIRQVIKVRTDESQDRLNQLHQETERRCPSFNLLKDAGVAPHISWELVH